MLLSIVYKCISLELTVRVRTHDKTKVNVLTSASDLVRYLNTVVEVFVYRRVHRARVQDCCSCC